MGHVSVSWEGKSTIIFGKGANFSQKLSSSPIVSHWRKILVKNKVFSKKETSKAIWNFFVWGLKHLYPFWLGTYPKKTHFSTRGSNLGQNLCGVWTKFVQPNFCKGKSKWILNVGNSFFKQSNGVIYCRTCVGIWLIK